MRNNVPAEVAVELLLEQDVTINTETIQLWELEGRILAEDICAAISVPSFDRSPYDGYALMAADTAGASPENPAVFKITAAAGREGLDGVHRGVKGGALQIDVCAVDQLHADRQGCAGAGRFMSRSNKWRMEWGFFRGGNCRRQYNPL